MREYVWKLVSMVKKQKRRERWTRGGLQTARRKVVEDVDTERLPEEPLSDEEPIDWDRRAAIIRRQIAECTRSRLMRDLVEWHLFEQVPVSDLAIAFEVSHARAKSAVVRTKRYLGIGRSRIARKQI